MSTDTLSLVALDTELLNSLYPIKHWLNRKSGWTWNVIERQNKWLYHELKDIACHTCLTRTVCRTHTGPRTPYHHCPTRTILAHAPLSRAARRGEHRLEALFARMAADDQVHILLALLRLIKPVPTQAKPRMACQRARVLQPS